MRFREIINYNLKFTIFNGLIVQEVGGVSD